MEDIYLKIKSIRLKKNLTQEQVAKGLGMAQSNYARMERGLSQITIERLSEIARVFEMSPEAIFSYSEGDENFKEDAKFYFKELQRALKQIDKLKNLVEELTEESYDSDTSEKRKLDTEKARVKDLNVKITALSARVNELQLDLERERKNVDDLKDKNGKLIDIIANINTSSK